MDVTSILMCIIAALITIAVYLVRRHFNYFKDLGIPCEEPSILRGNFRDSFQKRYVAQVTTEYYNKFKGQAPFAGFFFFQRPGVMLLDQQLMKNVLIKDFSNFVDRGMYSNEKDDPLTGHLFNLDGAKWRNLRNKLSSTFTSGKMKFMFPTVIEVAERFVTVLGETLEKEGNVLEVKDLLARFTTDVIGTCAFGVECNSLKDPNAEFRMMGRRMLTARRHGPLVMGFILGFPNLARKLHCRVITDASHNFFINLVRKTVDYRVNNKIERNDFLNMLIELSKDKETGHGLTVEQMAAQVFVFFIAGFETSSTTMGYLLYELALHQEIQDRLRQEVLDTLEKHNNDYTYECMNDMPYMDQVVAETLRKYTIVPHLNRRALSDYVVPGNPKYVIKKGMSILIPAYAIHHDPEIYPDPEKFDPERFTPEQVKNRDSVLWLPFGDGPRNCIGLRFGKMQVRIGLSYLLKNFKFSTSEKTVVPLVYEEKSFLLASKDGIYLKVERV